MFDLRWILHLISGGLALPEIEQNYKLKTERAVQIQNIERQSIIELARRKGVKLRFLIFGPNEDSPDFTTHRLPIKTMIEECVGQIADFPEKVDFGSLGRSKIRSKTRLPTTQCIRSLL